MGFGPNWRFAGLAVGFVLVNLALPVFVGDASLPTTRRGIVELWFRTNRHVWGEYLVLLVLTPTLALWLDQYVEDRFA